MKLFSILESNVQEALELGIAKDYAEYIRRPETEKVIDNLMAKLKQQSTFTGKESKRGERIYFDYDNTNGEKPEKFRSMTMDGLELTLYNNSDLFKELFGKTYSIQNGKDYLDGLVTDSKGQKIGIGKVFNAAIDKLKKKGDEESLRIVQRFEYNRRAFQEDQARNNVISRKNKKTYIVISKANYDIAGMTSGRNWSSCMSLTSGNGKKYIHCDIKEGTLIAYLINGDDTNIQRPIARVLIKPFISVENYKDYLYVVEEREYGTAPGFTEVVQDMFREAQPDKSGRYKINRKLYPDSNNREVTIRKSVEVLSQELFDKLKYNTDEDNEMVRIWSHSLELESENINSRDIKKIEKINTKAAINISSIPNLSEISNIETSDYLTIRETNNLKKVFNLKCKEINVYECDKLEIIENIDTKDVNIYGVNKEGKVNIKKITGKSDSVYIYNIDQESLDNLDLSELETERVSFSFSGESFNKFTSRLGNISILSLRNCENLKELPKKIGTGYNILVFFPDEIRKNFKVPEGANYKII